MKNKNIFQSFKNAFEGLIYVSFNHRHFKLEIALGILAIIYFILLGISYLEWIIVIFTIIFVLFSEVLNTIIEEICNIINPEYNYKIKLIKDMSGSLVLFAVIFSLIIFIIITFLNLF